MMESVPLAWLVGGLWVITMGLAGAWGRSAISDLKEISHALQSVAKSLASLEARVYRLEKDAPHYVTNSRFEDVRQHLSTLGDKLDRLLERSRDDG